MSPFIRPTNAGESRLCPRGCTCWLCEPDLDDPAWDEDDIPINIYGETEEDHA